VRDPTAFHPCLTSVPVSDRAAERRYWLVKSEPGVFSFDDLWAAPDRTTGWDGVRNHQARNYMRDDMRIGDGVLFYHSNAEPPGVAGLAEVACAAYPDMTALDPAHDHFDPKSRAYAPTWLQVDIRAVERFPRVLGLPELRAIPALAGMEVLRKGSRLSVQPVRAGEWEAVCAAGRRLVAS
jgi:predicted RNA-binding protein with PUA-like domain